MHTLLTTTIQQQLAADRHRRFRDAADRSRRHRTPVAPDLIRTVDLGQHHLPGALPAAVRIGRHADVDAGADTGAVAA